MTRMEKINAENVTKKNSRVVVIPEQFFGLKLIELLEIYILEICTCERMKLQGARFWAP